METVKILQDRTICFDGVKRVSFKKGQQFNATDEQVGLLVDLGVVLDPKLEPKEAKEKRDKILIAKEKLQKKLNKSQKIKVSTDATGKFVFKGKEYKSLEAAKSDLQNQLEAFEKLQADFNEKVKAFEKEKAEFESEKESFLKINSGKKKPGRKRNQ